MSKRIIITEEEKNEIKSLYNINEQGAGDILKSLADTIVNMIKTGKFGDDDNDENEDSYLNDTNSGSVDSKWSKVTKKVINEFEGGYWNPKCGHQTAGMGKSTETMFGLDRYNGDIEKTPEGKEFFRLIDNEKNNKGMEQFCKKWKWNYKGGELEDTLKNLASKIMKHQYDNNSKNYFSPELKERVESNDRLLMHFAYATWNGPGFFKKFAKSLEDGIKSGKSDSELVKQAISDRKNTSLLNQDKVASIMTSSDLNLA
jgi:hypothetical protein